MAAKFSADYGRRVCTCKDTKCKKTIEKNTLRLAKVTPNPFSESADEMKNYYHADCLFETFKRARATTKVIESVGDVDGYAQLQDTDKEYIRNKIAELQQHRENKTTKTKSPAKQTTLENTLTSRKRKAEDVVAALPAKKAPSVNNAITNSTTSTQESVQSRRSDSWRDFGRLCKRIADVSGHKEKTATVEKYIHDSQYDGDLYLLMKMLLPNIDQRVYNLGDKQLIKIFAEILAEDSTDLEEQFLQSGEISDIIANAFEKSTTVRPAMHGTLDLQAVDAFLDELSKCQHDINAQKRLFRKVIKRCTRHDLLWLIRVIKKDLRINSGIKHIISALAGNAYEAFQSCRNLKTVVAKVQKKSNKNDDGTPSPKKSLSVGIALGQPVLPMLAEACKSVEFAFKRCPHGMFAEIKYDGERVQLHKSADDKFHFFSRSLKPVQAHKVSALKQPVRKAFASTNAAHGVSLIIDSEVLVVDTRSGKPLPFGTLGKNKKKEQSYAQECLFVFDILMYNGESLIDKPLIERKRLLKTHMKEVPNRVMFSDYEHIHAHEQHKLHAMIDGAITEGLEGLVMKDPHGIYEPGKRHWLKVKKDYINEGQMADTADLLVLGAYFGTGNKGGIMSVFLLGVRDANTNTYRTVTKCGNGHDDATLERINRQLTPHMTRIHRDGDRLPSWLQCARSLAPDFIINDPKQAPCWEITGAEFTKSTTHTADGISIRFPRVTRIRNDKDYMSATTLQELKKLVDASKVKSDIATPQKTARALADTSTTVQDDQFDVEDGLYYCVFSDKTLLAEGTGLAARLVTGRFVHDDTTSQKRTYSASTKDDETDEPLPKVRRKATAESQKKKTEPVGGKEKCKYGADCYRKSAEHKARFWHPAKKASPTTDANALTTTSTNTSQSADISAPILQHYSIHIHSSSAPTQQERDDLTALVQKCGCRQIVSNAQDLLPGATVICMNREAAESDFTSAGLNAAIASTLSYVKPKWLYECVAQGRIVDKASHQL